MWIKTLTITVLSLVQGGCMMPGLENRAPAAAGPGQQRQVSDAQRTCARYAMQFSPGASRNVAYRDCMRREQQRAAQQGTDPAEGGQQEKQRCLGMLEGERDAIEKDALARARQGRLLRVDSSQPVMPALMPVLRKLRCDTNMIIGPAVKEIEDAYASMVKQAVEKANKDPEAIKARAERDAAEERAQQEYAAKVEAIRKSKNPLQQIVSMELARAVYPARYDAPAIYTLGNLNETTGKYVYMINMKAFQSLGVGQAMFMTDAQGPVILAVVPKTHPRFKNYAFNVSEASYYDFLGKSLGVVTYTAAGGAIRSALKVEIVYVKPMGSE